MTRPSAGGSPAHFQPLTDPELRRAARAGSAIVNLQLSSRISFRAEQLLNEPRGISWPLNQPVTNNHNLKSTRSAYTSSLKPSSTMLQPPCAAVSATSATSLASLKHLRVQAR